MRGKFGLVLGLGIGYVLGTRAGRERYEQIKGQAVKVWNLDPVQKQVEKVREAGRSAALALPRAAWNGVVKLVHVASPSTEPSPQPAPAQSAAPAKPAPRRSPAKKPAARTSSSTVTEPTDRTPSEALESAREKIDEAEGPAANERAADEG